ncbi:MAG: XTP/dITP diphosphatase [Verrucomicrobiota bacterium]|nr:XTP/dITP diphosphatase [Verrucomicrobiota bacterium]
MIILIATRNIHKVREFRSMLKPISELDVRSLADFPSYTPLEETGTTFAENAIVKAVHAAQALNLWTLADDSGLVVPALRGAPGIYSARYAGEGASDSDNRRKLLEEMSRLEDEARNGFFECSIALASPQGLEKVTTGVAEGVILAKERGGGGFGYDPLFVKHGYNKTFAELDEMTKNRISHRRKALDKMLPFLESLVAAETPSQYIPKQDEKLTTGL